MAYLQPKLLIFIKNNKQPITAMIDKVAFRKYWGKRKDKETGRMVRARKSMPYAICSVVMSQDPEVSVGAQFTIPGYKLQNVIVKNDKALAFHHKYEVEFAESYGNEWVRTLINEETNNEHNL
tara:strand:- start:604 stop:972 length:369 start_codon:yes stop_codon:yes gene_type:complete